MSPTVFEIKNTTAIDESLLSPDTVSSSSARLCSCSEWQQCGLPPQHRKQLLDVGSGPILLKNSARRNSPQNLETSFSKIALQKTVFAEG